MEETLESTASHVRCFADLAHAASNTYACINPYDLYRRTVNMISSIEYGFLYLVVLYSTIINDPLKDELCKKWKRISIHRNIYMPGRSVVDILDNVDQNVPNFTNLNYEIVKKMILNYGYQNDNKSKLESPPILLLSRSMDSSGFVVPAEPKIDNSSFNLKKRPFHIDWNHNGGVYDIQELHVKQGIFLNDNDLEILTDKFIWPNLRFTRNMSLLDKLSLILTGYIYSGDMDLQTIERFYCNRKVKDDCLEIPDVVFYDLKQDEIAQRLSILKKKMNEKMKQLQN